MMQHLSKIRIPSGGEKVYKDECVFSFDNPESETGLYVCLNSFLGFGRRHVERYFRKTGNAVFLHLRRIKRELPKSDEEPEKKKPTKLAIGVEGGFAVDEKKYDFEEHNSVVVLPDWTKIPLPNTEIPDMVSLSVAAVLAAESATKLAEAAAMAGTWEGEKRIVSKHAENLVQLDNGKKIPPKGWKCEMCDLTSNLWLNLTDGAILCGRKFFDGSGGNNHAVDYYAQTKYPLAVKLGTITPDGADVYSYDEDDMVENPCLAKHLAHWGINVAAMEKTDKTMLELEIDLNQKIGEWDVIQEAGSKLEPVYGPGYTGMHNLGNSCYMNSTMQVLFSVPEFKQKYADQAESYYDSAPLDPTSDFNVQMAKLGHGLLSGDYSKPEEPEDSNGIKVVKPNGIRPHMFKNLIGQGHPEFSTKRQQDAQEFLLHLISVIERNSRNSSNPCDCFRFEVEERIKCIQSQKVKYTKRADYILALPIPLDALVNKDEFAAYESKRKEVEASGDRLDPKELVRPKIPLKSCIEAFAAQEMVDDFYSTALKAKSVAQKMTRLSTFPDYLIIQLKKFTIGDDWVPKKLDVSVDIPDDLDLSDLRGQGRQPGEEELPEEAGDQSEKVTVDEAVVQQLADMGFPANACRKAVYYTNNTGVESAMNWVMQHMDDQDFAEPLQVLGQPKRDDFAVSEEGLAMIMSMGFSGEQAVRALKATDNNTERAVDWIFSHADELDQPMETEAESASDSQPKYRDGPGKYKLLGFISHMGTSTLVGHYVCHIRKEGRWIIFNDEKVALSEHPPKDLAYLYVYQRVQ
ncbi:ubiquitin carboxyl-terminal hydrolase 5 [Lingula anatina]|uniref:Ubiquitin carboxyl-terminal hydrolase n=1 Tax=Lingula anatina TaxID=7574 RepID=A0A1S3K6I8_LINAN|nr:ubiquitin carboxyl-terminal hydrolase 5 [Lingula anatina]|eukprot:XP_013417871.1 ubiquitin carboxyl-terminal hydrolase 5 [Lingula anatina]